MMRTSSARMARTSSLRATPPRRRLTRTSLVGFAVAVWGFSVLVGHLLRHGGHIHRREHFWEGWVDRGAEVVVEEAPGGGVDGRAAVGPDHQVAQQLSKGPPGLTRASEAAALESYSDPSSGSDVDVGVLAPASKEESRFAEHKGRETEQLEAAKGGQRDSTEEDTSEVAQLLQMGSSELERALLHRQRGAQQSRSSAKATNRGGPSSRDPEDAGGARRRAGAGGGAAGVVRISNRDRLTSPRRRDRTAASSTAGSANAADSAADVQGAVKEEVGEVADMGGEGNCLQ